MASEGGKSKLVQAIEDRKLPAIEFTVNEICTLDTKEPLKIAMRPVYKFEQDNAIISAHKAAKHWAGDVTDALSDDDLLGNAKVVEILFNACRRCEDSDDKGKGYNYPAFPGPEWMRQNMTTDQLAVLLNLYEQVREKVGPLQQVMSMAEVRTVAELCAQNCDTDAPDVALARMSRDWLSSAFILLATEWFNDKSRHGESGGEDRGRDSESERAAGEDPGDHDSGDGEASRQGEGDEEVC